jgi:iron complex outermembrane receptor protein
VTTRFEIPGGPLLLTAGVAYDDQHQRRKGFVNNNGSLGDLRRDEDDYVSDTDGYVQAEWALDSFSLLAGLRYSDVRFKSNDHYINALNPDDSGSVSYSHPNPVVGAVWHVTDDFNVYANYGVGFETPSFIELAYRNVGSGLNFALQPAISKSAEVGIKVLLPNQRLNAAMFWINTTDELVIDTATGGRTTYTNAAKTRRRGFEAEWDAILGNGFTAYASYTYLLAEFAAAATTGSPPQLIPAGSRLPGIPASSAYAELTWAHPEWYGFSAAIEGQYANKVYVNDRNSDYAPAYAVANIRAGFQQVAGQWTFTEFARINNVTGRNYSGTVIVGDINDAFSSPRPNAISWSG